MNFRELFQSTAFKVTATIVLALALQGALLVGFMSWSVFRFADGRAERFRETALADRKEALRDKVQLAYTVVESAYNRSRDLEGLKRDKEQELKRMVEAVVGQAEYLLKTRDRAAAEEDIKRLVTGLRFDGGNYVWINDLTPAMVLHPVRPDLNGKDLKDFKDPRGKALFVDMVRAVREGNGAGLVDYLWAKPGETEPKLKISYVRLLPALGWIFGSGAWVEDITARMQAQALAEVGRMRLADGNYFWINDSTLPVPRMVMHPTVPALDGKLLDDPKFDCATVQQAGAHGAPEDVGGHKNLFTAAAEVATQAGEGYVTYLWPKPKGSGTTAERYPKLSYVKLFKPWGWVLGMGAYVDEIDAQTAAQKAEMRESVRGTVAGSALFGLLFLVLFGLLAALLIRREIGRPLARLVRHFNAIAGGDLDSELDGRFSGEVGVLRHHMQAMVGSLKDKIRESAELAEVSREEAERARRATGEADEARRQAEQARRQGMLEAAASVETAVDGLSRASERLAERVREVLRAGEVQRGRTGETATAMEEMNATVMEVARNAELAAGGTEETRDTAAQGAELARTTVASMNRVHELTARLKSDMDGLSAQAGAIGRIVSVITDIADQTNLLALNAAIEAARAGDAGRGFAVVADEVRKLAEKTMTATKEVGEAVAAIQAGAERNRQGVDQAGGAVEEAVALVTRSGESLARIASRVQEAADQVRSIATASEEQSAASEEITKAVEDVSRITAETAQGMDEASRAIGDLVRLAAELKDLVERLRAG